MYTPTNNLKLTLVQTELVWQQAAENCTQIEKQLEGAEDTDIIVLPEMFNSGFTLDATKVAETMQGKTVDWMCHLAEKHNAAVTGSLVINDWGNHYNRMVFAQPDGVIHYYDKRHLFRMANEQNRYSAGHKHTVVKWRGWRIALFVCYDLRFPVWCRSRNDIDLMLFVASWPGVRRHAWQQLLIARAIENICYVAGVNRIGTDANKIHYTGDSMLVDMIGETTLHLEAADTVQTVTLDASTMAEFREMFPAWMDADEFQITGEVKKS
ncbi:MAG: amidohydrolase [Enterobacterales bacterium]|nr:amidohydrolase [Enterobacterales bacterium]